jgi:hypothetical protein
MMTKMPHYRFYPYQTDCSTCGGTIISYIIAIWYVIQFLSFSFRATSFLPPHSRCREVLLHLVTLSDTHTHSVRLLWTRDRSAAELSNYITHNIRKRETCVAPAGLEPTIPACERSQPYALDRADIGTGM